jgi:hypothetical protein
MILGSNVFSILIATVFTTCYTLQVGRAQSAVCLTGESIIAFFAPMQLGYCRASPLQKKVCIGGMGLFVYFSAILHIRGCFLVCTVCTYLQVCPRPSCESTHDGQSFFLKFFYGSTKISRAAATGAILAWQPPVGVFFFSQFEVQRSVSRCPKYQRKRYKMLDKKPAD